MTSSRAQTGRAGEAAAAAHYAALGFIVEARNWRCAVGELDLVVVRGALLVVVEVRSERTGFLGSAAESVRPAKQARVARAADAYLRARPGVPPDHVRFDVAAVAFRDEGAQVEVFESAFTPPWAF